MEKRAHPGVAVDAVKKQLLSPTTPERVHELLATGDPSLEVLAYLLSHHLESANFSPRFLSKGRSGAKVLLILQHDLLPFVVKFGHEALIDKEVHAYEEHVHRRMAPDIRPELSEPAEDEEGRFASFAYTWAGGRAPAETLKSFLAETDSKIEDVEGYIGDLMLDMADWYTPDPKTKQLPFHLFEFDAECIAIIKKVLGLESDPLLGAITDHAKWEDKLRLAHCTTTDRIHGDLNCDNVLVVEKRRQRALNVIDFASIQAKRCPARDWARLARDLEFICLREIAGSPDAFGTVLNHFNSAPNDLLTFENQSQIKNCVRMLAAIENHYIEIFSKHSDIARIEFLYHLLCWKLAFLGHPDFDPNHLGSRQAIIDSARRTLAELEAAISNHKPIANLRKVGALPALQSWQQSIPRNLQRWQKSDGVLALLFCAALALIGFGYSRVLPYSASSPALSGQDVIQRSMQLISTYAPELKWAGSYSAHYSCIEDGDFGDEVLSRGLPTALKLATMQTDWKVEDSTRSDHRVTIFNPGSFVFGPDGSLHHATLPHPAFVTQMPPPPVAAVAPLASSYAQLVFGADTKNIPFQEDWYDLPARRWQKHWGNSVYSYSTPVEWDLPGRNPNTNQEIVIGILDQHLVSARRSVNDSLIAAVPFSKPLSCDYCAYAGSLVGLFVAVSPLVGLGLLWISWPFRTFLNRKVVKGAAIAASFFTGITVEILRAVYLSGKSLPFSDEFTLAWIKENVWALSVSSIVPLFFVFMSIILVATYYFASRVPAKVATIARVVSDPRPVGLAIIRGLLLGALYVAFHVGSLWVSGTFRLASTSDFEVLGTDPSFTVFVGNFLPMLLPIMVMWVQLGPLLWFRKHEGKLFWCVLVGSTLMLGLVGVPGTAVYPVIPSYILHLIQAAFLLFVFFRYDLLTYLTAVWTIGMAFLTYAAFSLFGRISPGPTLAGFVPFLLVVGLGAFTYFRPTLNSIRYRALELVK